MVQRMTGPDRITANELSKEVGVHQTTLSGWLRKSTEKIEMKRKPKTNPKVSPNQISPQEKLRIVIEAESLSEKELGEFLRRQGIHEAHLEEWKKTVAEAATEAFESKRKKKKRLSPEAKKIKELEKELKRKDKALAEVTALLALKKKVDLLWGGGDDDTAGKNGKKS
jgi:transposase-like protein